jgi:hypothetical protein
MNYSGFLLLLLQAVSPQPAPGLPDSPGVYFQQVGPTWKKVEPASLADTRTKGMDLFIQTGGFFSPNMTIVYKGSRAPTQISLPRPTFYVRRLGSPRDVILVQLTPKKDSRTLQTSANEVASDNKGGFNRKEIQSATVTAHAEDLFSITPDKDLKPGEYLLLLSLTDAGFDFSITLPKK